MNRTRRMPLKDWVDHSSNGNSELWIKYPPNRNGNVIIHDVHYDPVKQTNPALRGRKVTSDESHGASWRNRKSGTFTGDVGGSFLSTTQFVEANGFRQYCYGEGVAGSNWVENKYSGPIFAIDPKTVIIPAGSLMKNLEPMGTTAIARCKPTNNVADLAVSIAEIRQQGASSFHGVPKWQEKTNAARNAGDGFLLSEFGWKPLVSDIRSASYAAANAHRLLDAYERNSGKIVRRRYEFPVEETEVTVQVGPSDGYSLANSLTNLIDTSKVQPTLYKTTKSYYKAWFSGAFTYHLPVGWNSRNKLVSAAAKAGPLLGLELTPEVVWNVVPWTWAADWFSNSGDVVSNLSSWAVDGLVLKWGYMMEHTVQSVTYTLAGAPCRYKPYGSTVAMPVTSWLETKKRVKATPFGFEVTWNGLSPRQLAISAALGIQRVF